MQTLKEKFLIKEGWPLSIDGFHIQWQRSSLFHFLIFCLSICSGSLPFEKFIIGFCGVFRSQKQVEWLTLKAARLGRM